MPKVSVIMNCHNGDTYLEEALDSIYAQTSHDWEIIFFDNASTDRSAEIAKSYDDRLRYIKNEELITLGAARREAVLRARGEWVAFLDTDDKWYPDKLITQLDGLPDADYIACYAGVREITPDGKKIRDVHPIHNSGNILEGLLHQFDVNMVTPMFRRDLVSKININFDPIVTASEEYNLFIRIAAKGRFLVQDIILGDYRVSPGSLTDRQISKWALERRYTLTQLEGENPGIKNRYPSAFREAEARGDYYEARFLMSESKYSNAMAIMNNIKNLDNRYRLLYYLSYFPLLWRIFHSNRIRLALLEIAGIFLFKRKPLRNDV
jgi:glycosyltransferase involved in cell wall biosynthesis